MLFADLAATSIAVGATRSRKRKAELLGETLRALEPGEVEPAVAYLSGALRQRRTGVGWASLQELPPPAEAPSLEIGEVDLLLERVSELSGAGSQAARRAAIADLFARASADEQTFLRGLLSGEVRQGALAGVM
ncbi:MAG: ATP-dependent ligase, partial [Conexibacter sp.]|nr:ATP-dependent ligase [Conexibacter sp.]